ncbi:hypothetical protein TNCV_3204991 [Trichonephila clavipes]|nr:hypothetical protein TNCV_3204991 [Trichonephila clavipes]
MRFTLFSIFSKRDAFTSAFDSRNNHKVQGVVLDEQSLEMVRVPSTTVPCTTEEAEVLIEFPDFTEDYYYEEIENDRDNSRYQEDEALAEVEELKKGVTKVMDPNICKYRKAKKMKWS